MEPNRSIGYRKGDLPTVPVLTLPRRVSLWLEFPDPFMSVIRNPTVGDTHDRYYFFPSDEYKSTAGQPCMACRCSPGGQPRPSLQHLCTVVSWRPNVHVGDRHTANTPTVTPPPSLYHYADDWRDRYW